MEKLITQMKLIIVLYLIITLSSCRYLQNSDEINENSYLFCTSGDTTVVTADDEKSDSVTTISSSDATKNVIKTTGAIYNYSPPQEVINTKFYCDDIEQKIELEWIGYDPSGYWCNDTSSCCVDLADTEFISELHCNLKKVIPPQIVDDMISCISEMDSSNVFTVVGMGYMLYDMDSDGKEDYIIASSITCDGMTCEYLYKLYIAQGEERYKPIKWDCSKQFNNIQYILSTYTNGMKDILVLHNNNYPIITYMGDDSYTSCQMLDERHTFLKYELLSNNVLHININVSVIDADVGEYYMAIKFVDNPYLKSDLLYTSYSDGTPRSYTFKVIGEWKSTDFNPSIDGYDFYVELNENEVDEFDPLCLELIEIKYVAAE